MGRQAKVKGGSRTSPGAARSVQTTPNWPLLALSSAGVLLTGYLFYTGWVGGSLTGCSEGSGCEVVLSSPWATFLGLPTTAWGALAYVALAASAVIPGLELRWKASWTLAFFGLTYSLYLTTVSLTILRAACPYCLTSFALMAAIFALVTYQRPRTFRSLSWPRRLRTFAAMAVVMLVAAHLHYTGTIEIPSAAEVPALRELAVHLSESGAKMYGASWCPHCQEQKAMFGAAARRLPYIECSTGGQGSPQTQECRDANIRNYPTWVINGTRRVEVMTPQQLAEVTKFPWPALE